MNKRIKRIIAITLSISALSIIEPTKYINLTNTVKANAEGSINTNLKLRGIYLSDGKIDFDSDKYEYDIKVPRSVEEIEIKAKPKEPEEIKEGGGTVEINGVEVDSDDNYERTVSLDRGENRITIKIINGKSSHRYKRYTLNIQRGTVSDSDEDEDDSIEDENIYLSDISLSSGIVNFSKQTETYDIKVDSSINEIEIKAKPEDSDYTVKIDGVSVDENDKYKRDVELKEGNNEIEIFIKDGVKENTYTLNITRGTDKTENTSDISTSIKSNQWVQVNNKWQYNDFTGKPLKNIWFYDRNNGKDYYLQADGTMAANWLNNNGHWYYLDQSGARQTGWQLVNGQWYYLDSQGIMQTGWILDSNGKYYYLKSNGAMVKNSRIGGYKLGPDGAWIK